MVSKIRKKVQLCLKGRRDGQHGRGKHRSLSWQRRLGLCGFIACTFAVVISPALAVDPALFRAAHLERFAQNSSLADVSLQGVDGKTIALRAFQGHIVLLNFWTTW